MIRAYNDWLSEYVERAPARFAGLAILHQDLDLAGPFDDVVVGDDVPAAINDEA